MNGGRSLAAMGPQGEAIVLWLMLVAGLGWWRWWLC
jgi:hypothetical protein